MILGHANIIVKPHAARVLETPDLAWSIFSSDQNEWAAKKKSKEIILTESGLLWKEICVTLFCIFLFSRKGKYRKDSDSPISDVKAEKAEQEKIERSFLETFDMDSIL